MNAALFFYNKYLWLVDALMICVCVWGGERERGERRGHVTENEIHFSFFIPTIIHSLSSKILLFHLLLGVWPSP